MGTDELNALLIELTREDLFGIIHKVMSEFPATETFISKAVSNNIDRTDSTPLNVAPKTCETVQRRQPDDNVKILNKYSAPEIKIALFGKLFSGRDDVYARRWESAKTGKSGYSPVCLNEWVRGVCEKPRVKCSACEYRALDKYTDTVISNHLNHNAGKDVVVGIYPMLDDETCNFIVIDFDKANWKCDVISVFDVCNSLEISAHLERSRSGNGAHLWFFFKESIPAKLARQFATTILDKTMLINHKIGFDSYDRLLPNQDNMPSGGFGNLIALPLQSEARKNGNSMFINRELKAYGDQWKYLAKADNSRLSKEFVQSFVTEHDVNKPDNLISPIENKKPKKSDKSESKTENIKYTDVIELILSNGIHIDISKLPNKLVLQIKKLATFRNPEFYAAQAMRFSTWNIPRVIATFDEVDNTLIMPRGLLEQVIELLDNHDIDHKITDNTNSGKRIRAKFIGELRLSQKQAIKALGNNDNGVIAAATAFGKTVTAANLICKRKTNVLILVPTSTLLKQWQESLTKFIDFPILKELNVETESKKKRGRKPIKSNVGLLGGGKNTLNGNVDVAIISSMFDKDNSNGVKDLVKDYGMIIVDECHHVSSVKFEQVLKTATAKYVYGLSATPNRADGHEAIIFQQCGPIRFEADAKTQAQNNGLVLSLVPQFTSFRLLTNGSNDNLRGSITKVFEELSASNPRNNMIIKDVVKSIDGGHTPIVITTRVEHANHIASQLQSKVKSQVIVLTGEGTAKQKRERLDELKAIHEGQKFVIVATGQYAGEGFDEPRLDTLFMATPVAWKGKLTQLVGRLHRQYEGKNSVTVYDYIDLHVPVLERMYAKRLRTYKNLGYKLSPSTQITKTTEREVSNLLFDDESYIDILVSDLQKSKKLITIMMPTLSRSFVNSFSSIFAELFAKGVIIKVIIRKYDKLPTSKQASILHTVEKLAELGVIIETEDDAQHQFITLDQDYVWYGNFYSSDISIMRILDAEVVGRFLDEIDKGFEE